MIQHKPSKWMHVCLISLTNKTRTTEPCPRIGSTWFGYLVECPLSLFGVAPLEKERSADLAEITWREKCLCQKWRISLGWQATKISSLVCILTWKVLVKLVISASGHIQTNAEKHFRIIKYSIKHKLLHTFMHTHKNTHTVFSYSGTHRGWGCSTNPTI